MLTIPQALVSIFVMAAVIVLCRAIPFLFFRGEGGHSRAAFIAFVERAVPPVAMTVLAFASIAGALKPEWPFGLPAVIAAVGTALLHLARRNVLLSIIGGTGLYMVLLSGMSG
jgi:branched-subunit amino acid transport protein AzlD